MSGATVRAITFTDEHSGQSFTPSHPGVFCGFAFFHDEFDSSTEFEFFSFRDIRKRLDSHAMAVIEKAVPGWYGRESADEPFSWEPLDLDDDDAEVDS